MPKKKQQLQKVRPQPRMVCCLSPTACCYAAGLVAGDCLDHDQISGIPWGLPIPSLKIKAEARSVFSTGTLDTGFVCVNPWLMLMHATDAICTSGPSYTGDSFATSGTGVTFNATNSPIVYSAAANVRVTGCVIEVQYDGTELDRGGHFVCAQALPSSATPDLHNASEVEVLRDIRNNRFRTTERRAYARWCPRDVTDLDYITLSGATCQLMGAQLGVLWSSPGLGAGHNCTYKVTVTGEVAPAANAGGTMSATGGNVTMTLPDEAGTMAVLAAHAANPTGSYQSGNSYLKKVHSAAKTVAAATHTGFKLIEAGGNAARSVQGALNAIDQSYRHSPLHRQLERVIRNGATRLLLNPP